MHACDTVLQGFSAHGFGKNFYGNRQITSQCVCNYLEMHTYCLGYMPWASCIHVPLQENTEVCVAYIIVYL